MVRTRNTLRARRTSAALAVVVLAVGCSSSLEPTSRLAGPDAAVDAASPDLDGSAVASGAPAPVAATAGSSVASAAAVPRGSAPGTGNQSAAPTTGPSAAAVSGRTSPTRSGPQTGRGFTATEITVGVVVIDYAGLQDVKGYNNGSPRVQAQAAADYVNARGGIGGRKVRLVFGEFPVTSNNWAADEQAICTQFTEDEKVFAVIAGALSQGKTFLPCLAKHDTPLISSAGGLTDDQGMAEFPRHYFYSGGITLSRLARSYVDGLAEAKFFGADAKVGLVRVDDQPYARTSDRILKPRLKELGSPVLEEAVVSAMNSLGDTASQMSSIVLRFQQRGINRVLFLDNASVGPLFAIQAASQGYYPRYGLTSASLPNAMAENVPRTALAGAQGVGWLPALDVFEPYEKTPTSAARVCREINVKAGQGDVSRTGQAQQRLYCDELFFLQRALARNVALTPLGLMTAVEALGASYDSATTFSTRFGSRRHDGAATTRTFAFVDSCACFQYTTALRPTD